MIAWLRGSVSAASSSCLVLDVGGFGIEVHCTPATALAVQIGDQVVLSTSLVVREDAWTMYGFLDADERATFQIVQTVSGIGPRIALTLLGTLTPDELRRAVAQDDVVALTKVPGIGRKGAQRLVLELVDRLGPVSGSAEQEYGNTANWQDSVRAALMSLGWQSSIADEAVQRLPAPEGDPDIGSLLKAALVSLDRR